MAANQSTPSIGFISLGCPKNLVDSERILTQLRVEGYQVSPSYEGADLVVVNTCGFIDDAVEESLEVIGEAINANGRVIVTGCLGVKEDDIRKVHPSVLAVTGPHDYEAVMGHIHQHVPAPRHPFVGEMPLGGVKLTPRHYAYLKISEGCNHRCSFCIIPQMRGDLVSRRFDDVMREAENLAKAGVRELLVVSQDTSAYGVDLKYATSIWQAKVYQTRIANLADALGDLGIWVRLHYIYPYPSVDKLIPLMAEGKILPYLDIPMQHASESILKSMKRPAAAEKMLGRIEKWREICPDITLRSTFITGFPGETEDDFQCLLDFLEEARLDRVGCFPYSPVKGATANDIAGALDIEVREERAARLMAVQTRISTEKLAEKVGQRQIVLIDEVREDCVIARSSADAPEIDGNVIIDGAWDLTPGDFIEVDMTDSDEHDLFARMSDIEDE